MRLQIEEQAVVGLQLARCRGSEASFDRDEANPTRRCLVGDALVGASLVTQPTRPVVDEATVPPASIAGTNRYDKSFATELAAPAREPMAGTTFTRPSHAAFNIDFFGSGLASSSLNCSKSSVADRF